jgi:thiol-disulfide isomerase/thioredoxin
MKTNHTLRRAGILLSFIALVGMVSAPVLAKSPKGKRPTVAIIRADWCSACQKLEPTMMELMGQYKDRIDFVMLDVTNDQKLAKAASDARKLGLGKFFQANKKKTSTVVVLGADRKILFQTAMNFDRDAYVKAFDEAIAQSGSKS